MEPIIKVTKYYKVSFEVSFEDAMQFTEIANKCGVITAIWCLRRMYPVGLKDARDFIDSLLVDSKGERTE